MLRSSAVVGLTGLGIGAYLLNRETSEPAEQPSAPTPPLPSGECAKRLGDFEAGGKWRSERDWNRGDAWVKGVPTGKDARLIERLREQMNKQIRKSDREAGIEYVDLEAQREEAYVADCLEVWGDVERVVRPRLGTFPTTVARLAADYLEAYDYNDDGQLALAAKVGERYRAVVDGKHPLTSDRLLQRAAGSDGQASIDELKRAIGRYAGRDDRLSSRELANFNRKLGERGLAPHKDRRGTVLKGTGNPSRFDIYRDSVTFEGTIRSVGRAGDGDFHIGVRLDPQYEYLLGPRQKHLVTEVVPMHQEQFPPPDIGDHVRMTGPWVKDTGHGWNEIHPVLNLEYNVGRKP